MARLFHLLTAFLMLCVLMSAGSAVMAHDSSVSTLKLVRMPTNSWVFELHTPLRGLDEAMRQYNEERLTELDDLAQDSKRYKELIVDYVKANFKLEPQTDNAQSGMASPSLGPGRMKLGEHASVLIFEVENMPQTTDELTLDLAYMENNPGQQNILWLIADDHEQRFVLRADNNFTVQLQ